MIASKRKSRATISNFAIVELKYEEKKMFLVPIERIQDFKPTFSLVKSFFCYISADPFEEPNFNAEYLKKYDGRSGVFKVFIRKLTATAEAAMKYQKDLQNKRIPSVPQKFREPANTDTELVIKEKQKKKKEKQIQKASQKVAETKNAAYLVDALKIAEENPLLMCVGQLPSSNNSFDKSNNGIAHTSATAESQKRKNDVLSPKLEKPVNQNNQSKNVIRKPVESKQTSNKIENNGQKIVPKSMVKGPKIPNCTVTSKALTYVECLSTDLSNKSTKIPNIVNGKSSLINNQQNKNLVNKNAESHAIQPLLIHENEKEKEVAFQLPSNENSQVVIGSKVGKSANKENYARGSTNNSVDPTQNVKKRSINNRPNNSLKNMVKKPKLENCTVTNGVTSIPCLLTDLTHKNSSTISNMVNGNNTSSDCVVINFDDILKKLAKMEQENSDYKARNEVLVEKNEALQLALIAAYKSAAKLLFEDTDEGRLYTDYKVLMTKNQVLILDNINEDNLYLNQLLMIVFGSDTLVASSVTGRQCNRTKGPAKPALDKIKLKFVYDLMAARTNGSDEFKKTAINKIINKKIANLTAALPQACKSLPNQVVDNEQLANAITDFSDINAENESENESIGDQSSIASIDAYDSDGMVDSESESEELLNLSDSVQVESEVEGNHNFLNGLTSDLTNIDDLVKMVDLGDLSDLTW